MANKPTDSNRCRFLGGGRKPNMPKLTPAELEDAKLFERGVECGRKEALKWRPISEAPRDGTPIWGYIPIGFQTSLVHSLGKWRKMHGAKEFFQPTHFMPLPQSPEGEK